MRTPNERRFAKALEILIYLAILVCAALLWGKELMR